MGFRATSFSPPVLHLAPCVLSLRWCDWAHSMLLPCCLCVAVAVHLFLSLRRCMCITLCDHPVRSLCVITLCVRRGFALCRPLLLPRTSL